MSRRELLSVAVPRNVCIFCANRARTRAHLRSSLPDYLSVPRRSIQSTKGRRQRGEAPTNFPEPTLLPSSVSSKASQSSTFGGDNAKPATTSAATANPGREYVSRNVASPDKPTLRQQGSPINGILRTVRVDGHESVPRTTPSRSGSYATQAVPTTWLSADQDVQRSRSGPAVGLDSIDSLLADKPTFKITTVAARSRRADTSINNGPDLNAGWQHLQRRSTVARQLVAKTHSDMSSASPTLLQQSASEKQPRTTGWQAITKVVSRASGNTEYLIQSRQREVQAAKGAFVNLTDNAQSICYLCNSKGHVSHQCTTYKPCSGCGQLGHTAARCPSRNLPLDILNVQANSSQSNRNTSGIRSAVFEPNTQSDNTGLGQRPLTQEVSLGSGVEYKSEKVPKMANYQPPLFEKDYSQSTLHGREAQNERLSRTAAPSLAPEEKPAGRNDYRQRSNRFVDNFELDDGTDRRKSKKAGKRADKLASKIKARLADRKAPTPIMLPNFISVAHLATALKVPAPMFLAKMEELGFENTSMDHVINAEDAGLIAQEYNFESVTATHEDVVEDIIAAPEPGDTSNLYQRPPIVTIMGHVDHGKTTILDYLRKTSVAASEFGGITQHIGAFSVQLSTSGKTITFLDTPGHAAFLSVRERGANVTDIVVLVVAADDSVKPQTIEAIKHARAANVPIIVAINKCDKEDATPQKVKEDLARNGVEIEDFGGDTQTVLVSGKTGRGIPELEEAIITLSEMQDYRVPVDGPVEGWVLEAATKKAGPVATVLVRRGTLRIGDIIVAGTKWARVRSLRDSAGTPWEEATPGKPVEIEGWRGLPAAGDEVLQAQDEQKATRAVDLRKNEEEKGRLADDVKAINEARKIEHDQRVQELAIPAKDRPLRIRGTQLFPDAAASRSADGDKSGTGGLTEVSFIIKTDVAGSAEAVENALSGLGNGEVRPRIIRTGVGVITESDIVQASAAGGSLIAFNVNIDARIKRQAEDGRVDIIMGNIIYHLVEDVKTKLSEYLKPKTLQRVTGEAEIAQVFPFNTQGRKQSYYAGCKIRNGIITRGSKARVLRGAKVVYDGNVISLKNLKKDVEQMQKGNECGMGFEGWEEMMPGDSIQCYKEWTEKRSL